MGGSGGTGDLRRIARLVGLAAGCLTLAHCANSNISSKNDPKWGVPSSTRVVEKGQPVPKGGGVYRVGKPYTVAGREYVPQEDVNYSATGMASWYGDDFHGRYTANGEIFDMNSVSAAHPTLPLPSYVRVTNLRNHRSIVVRVNDRGPYVGDRVIDLSVRAATLLGFYGHGLAKVKVDYVGRAPLAGSDDSKLASTLRENTPEQAPAVQLAFNKPFAPAYFDARPMTHMTADAAVPQRTRGATIELAAAARPQGVQTGQRAQLPPPDPAVSPVSAYAPARYDGSAGFMSGRGLY